MTQTAEPAAYITDSGISHTGPWWHLRFPNGAAMNVHSARTPAFTFGAEIEEAPGAEMTTLAGLTTEQVWAHAARLAALPPAPTAAPIQLDEDGHPYRGYIDDVTAALIAKGIAATDPHWEEPWDFHVQVPCTGDYASYELLLLCWRGDELEPATGLGWYLLPHDDPNQPGASVNRIGVPFHATPDEVADEVWAYLLDDAPADAQATPTDRDGDDQGDPPICDCLL